MAGIDTPMNFELLRDSIETLLKSYEAGRFKVVTEQKQNSGAEEHKGLFRSIQIFYESGEYPDGTSAMQEVTHDTIFQIEYIVTASAKADLSILNDPDASVIEYSSALSAAQSAARVANRSIDELKRMVSQIILDPVNIDNNLGLGKTATGGNYLGDTRLVNFRKNAGIPRGKLFELTASEQLTTNIQETFTGATPLEPVQPAIGILHKFNTQTDDEDATPAQTSADIDTTA
jgi:hypothetical protein